MSELQLGRDEEIRLLALDRAVSLHRETIRLHRLDGDPDVGGIVLKDAARFDVFIRGGNTIELDRPDDEHLQVVVNGFVVAEANHDEHGWSGMDAVEKTAVAVARALGGTVTEAEPDDEADLDEGEDVDVHDPAHEESAPPD